MNQFEAMPTTETHEHGNEQMDAAWEAQSALYSHFREVGAQAAFNELGSIRDSFENNETICCIDERVSGSLHSAGSLVLLPEDEARAYIEKSGAKNITSHSGCGAMKLAYMQEKGLGADADIAPETVDAYAVEKTQALAEKYGLQYTGNTSYEQMQGPSEFHVARAIYYVDGVDGFNPLQVPGLLPGFVINRSYLSPEEAQKEVALAQGIAFGGHGFGSHFEEEPLLIMCVGSNPEQLKAELQAAALSGKYPSVLDTVTL